MWITAGMLEQNITSGEDSTSVTHSSTCSTDKLLAIVCPVLTEVHGILAVNVVDRFLIIKKFIFTIIHVFAAANALINKKSSIMPI